VTASSSDERSLCLGRSVRLCVRLCVVGLFLSCVSACDLFSIHKTGEVGIEYAYCFLPSAYSPV